MQASAAFILPFICVICGQTLLLSLFKTMNPAALKWIAGNDTGISSKTIWSVMMDVVDEFGGRFDRPYDGADFGRCHRLLALIPEWKPRLPEVAARFPAWGPLVREWARIEAAYLADLQARGSRATGIIRSLEDECMTAAGYIKTSPSSWHHPEARTQVIRFGA